MDDVDLESFYRHYTRAIHERTAAVFAGAGLSRESGYVDWRGLLKHIAEDLGLDIDREADLIAVAQYHENKHKGRDEINRAILEEFTKDAKLTENHSLIANLPIDTVWTTNYDDLLEQAFKAARRKVDAKITTENLPLVKPGRSVVIYKMHGDISLPDKAVITKDDYETYDVHRELFSIKLKGDLVGRTFLFLGFSFTDPNIEYVLSRIRSLLGKNKGTHYCIMRRPGKKKGMKGKALANHEYELAKLALRVTDLERYGIRALMIDSFTEVTEILREVNRRSHLRDVFLSGSALDFSPLGEERVKELSRQIGQRLISSGCNLVSGVGLGIGGYTTIGALETLNADVLGDHDDRIFLRPFPQEAPAGVSLARGRTKRGRSSFD